MTTTTALRRAINDWELPHARFNLIRSELAGQIDDTLNGGFAPFLECVVGPSRVGKSMLIDSLSRDYPTQLHEGTRCVPVLVVELPPYASPKQLPLSVLKALKAPIPTTVRSGFQLVERMSSQLRLAKTRVILFEEANHIVDSGSRIQARAAGDWFKHLLDELQISIVLSGIPKLELLFESNEQLRLRGSEIARFYPYSWMIPEEQRQFAACVKAYTRKFEEHGVRFDVGLSSLVQNCFLLSGGLVGVLSKFMCRLAYGLNGSNASTVTFEMCADTASKIGRAGQVDHPAFQEHEVPPIRLNAVYTSVLKEGGMRPRKSPK